MASSSPNMGTDKHGSLSPLGPAISLQVESEKACVPKKKTSDGKFLPTGRRGYGSKGQKIQLLTNHFKVKLTNKDGGFYHYTVALFYEDGRPVEAKGIGRRVIDKVYETYASELQSKNFAYDGEKSLFTLSSLPHNKLEFKVVLDEISSNKLGKNGSADNNTEGTDKKRMRRPFQSKTYKVEISYAKKIPMQAIVDASSGLESDHHQESLRVLDIILRQRAAKQGCLLVRQSFFHNKVENYRDIGGGVQGCRGFHSSFRATQGGLSLNVDVSTTLLLKPGPVLDFLCMNQNVNHPGLIDWTKAKRMLKNLRIKANNMEYKITGLSERPCKDQTFSLKQGREANGEVKSIEITVREYYERHKNIRLLHSANLPCINVGKPKKPTYFPLELCTLVSLQRYTKALTSLQRASVVEVSRQKPHERMTSLTNSLRNSGYNDDPMFRSSGIDIGSQFTRAEGRVLLAPKLRVGKGEEFLPRNGRWNFNNKQLFQPVVLARWAIVSFSARCNIRQLIEGLKRCAQMKGMTLYEPVGVFQEDQRMSRKPANVRVEELYKIVMNQMPGLPQFLLCILPERKNSDIYGPWKRINLAKDGKGEGVVTQCIAPTKMNDQYFTNVLLKINAKLGGMNSFLAIEHSQSIPIVSKVPTLILGMDVSHGSPGRSDVPSIAAVVSSRYWPQVSRYRASVRAQTPKLEIIANLFNPVSDTEDHGIFKELLDDFINSSGMRPEHIVIFRDGVSESQFSQVLNIELDQIIQACKCFQESWDPKFTVIIAQKNHHTKFFQQVNARENVPPGTVIDNTVCHSKNNDFYMCAHAGMIGTSRPTHYHVLCDEIGFSADELQEFVHSLCYVYQRSTTAISVVAPICYAHLAAAQVAQFIKFDELSESSSSSSSNQFHELPRLHDRVRNSMFFC
ncbi:protein argonaute 4A-like [Prosopis cineraria]|uniref:protein argonaute 4A-like n=1 Tax=Prosopis cineraria TaxID=364024 RepID=UPI0024102765|nr:protein argonaute 4A-like [Prosopis cineraria]